MVALAAHATLEHQRERLLIAASLVLTIAAAASLAVGMYSAELRLSDFGLASSYPPIFYVGLVLLTLASSLLWFSNRHVDRIILAQLLLLLIALWLSPYLLESTPRFRAAFKNFAAADYLLRGDGFAPDAVIYHNWPLLPGLTAGFLKLTNMQPTTLMGVFPFFIELAYLAPLAVILRSFNLAKNHWWAGVWFFYLFNWTGQDYYSPQAFAFLLFLSLAAVLAYVVQKRKGRFSTRLVLAAIGLYGAIVLTHALTAMIALTIVGALVLGRKLRQPSLVLALAMIFAGWQAYGAASFFGFSGDRILDGLFEPTDFFNLNVGNRLAGNPSHVLINQLRMLMALLAFGLGGLALVVGLAPRYGVAFKYKFRRSLRFANLGRWIRYRRMGTPVEAMSFAVLLLVPLFVLAPVYVYGGEILIRVLLFSLPALAVLVAAALSVRIAALATISALVLAVTLHMLGHYGNELYDYVSPGELAGFEFVASELPSANIFGGYPAGAFQNQKRIEWRHAVTAGKNKLPTVEDYLHPDERRWENPDRPLYVAISRGDAAGARLFYNVTGFDDSVRQELDGRCNFQIVYENESFSLYEFHQTCSYAGS